MSSGVKCSKPTRRCVNDLKVLVVKRFGPGRRRRWSRRRCEVEKIELLPAYDLLALVGWIFPCCPKCEVEKIELLPAYDLLALVGWIFPCGKIAMAAVHARESGLPTG
jgi:hypothetical protein